MLTAPSIRFKDYIKIFLFWTGLISLYVLMMFSDAKRFGEGFLLTPAFIKTVLINIVFWTALSVFLFKRISHLIRQKSSLKIIVGFFVLNLLWLPLIIYANHWLIWFFTFMKPPSSSTVLQDINFIYVYVVIIQYLFLFSICYGLNYQLHAFQIEIKTAADNLAFSDMKMQTLQSQLSPHFLFNSLSSISGLVRRNEPDKTLDLIADLGDLLRFSIDASKIPLIELDKEIHFTEKYIDLQKIRFGQRYQVNLDMLAPNHLMCPPFILQTLVENAYLHSNRPKSLRQQITATIKAVDNQLMIQVINPLESSRKQVDDSDSNQGLGLALSNLENRLHILFKDNYQLLKSKTSSEFKTTVMIPLLTTEDHLT